MGAKALERFRQWKGLVINMWKEKLENVFNYINKHSKVAFPVIIIAAVAITVTVALNAGSKRDMLDDNSATMATEASTEVVLEGADTLVPLSLNEDSAITTLITTFYNAMALGDAESLTAVCDEISEKDMLHYLETAKYIESYPTIEIYTKPGPEDGSTIAYVYYKVAFTNQTEAFPGYKAYYICKNEQGELYIKRGENSDEVNEYIKTVSAQDDVVEFNNRVTVEYNELMVEHPELLEYLSELDSQVSTAVGVTLAQQAADAEQALQSSEETPAEGDAEAEGGEQNEEQPAEETSEENVPQYATTTTTVNVRNSDSEQADKLGKVTGGTELQVLEQRVNGWTKVLYEGQEGFIKSEFLQIVEKAANVESADGTATIGTVTALTNINVRSSASETAEKLGVLAGGDSAELIAKENDWCKIKYNGQVGYVKAEFVE